MTNEPVAKLSLHQPHARTVWSGLTSVRCAGRTSPSRAKSCCSTASLRCASPRTASFWEYDGRRFLVTDVIAGAWRKPAGDLDEIPPGPWRHVPACVCEACRLGNV